MVSENVILGLLLMLLLLLLLWLLLLLLPLLHLLILQPLPIRLWRCPRPVARSWPILASRGHLTEWRCTVCGLCQFYVIEPARE